MCIVIIVIIILVVIVRRNNYSKQLTSEINEVRIIYLLISKRTILEEPTLKAKFLEQVPDIPGLK
jgi:glucan phosphoethanolaminetransferase (alkaline phosphatase superfamily)